MNHLPASKNLILGCAFNYANQDILPFLNSLQACGYSDELILLTNNQSKINLEGYSYKGSTINVDKDFKYSRSVLAQRTTKDQGDIEVQNQRIMNRTLARLQQEKSLSKPIVAFFYNTYFLMTSRYFLYYYYLLQTDYTHVFLTDVNDVIFQSNPFEKEYENGVTAFAEQDGISIAQEVTNRFWILETFGEAVLQNMANEVVYCAGTILLKNSVKQFLKDFLSIVINQHISTTIQGIDQGVFNYMLSYLRLNYFHCKKNGDIVLTVANVPEPLVTITAKGMSLNGRNDLPAVVHQYTRFEQQRKYAVEKYQKL
ncbi:MAG: hypothetical protein EOP45_22770 [Sphingobacteriaceae bacterium]|nr:MAG: hypothetical protein EOP45_22770 [Sphingobacteriaceae bacterium]